MKKRISYSKDAHLHIRVDSEDVKRWQKCAIKRDLSLTDFAIIAMNYSMEIGGISDPARLKPKPSAGSGK